MASNAEKNDEMLWQRAQLLVAAPPPVVHKAIARDRSLNRFSDSERQCFRAAPLAPLKSDRYDDALTEFMTGVRPNRHVEEEVKKSDKVEPHPIEAIVARALSVETGRKVMSKVPQDAKNMRRQRSSGARTPYGGAKYSRFAPAVIRTACLLRFTPIRADSVASVREKILQEHGSIQALFDIAERVYGTKRRSLRPREWMRLMEIAGFSSPETRGALPLFLDGRQVSLDRFRRVLEGACPIRSTVTLRRRLLASCRSLARAVKQLGQIVDGRTDVHMYKSELAEVLERVQITSEGDIQACWEMGVTLDGRFTLRQLFASLCGVSPYLVVEVYADVFARRPDPFSPMWKRSFRDCEDFVKHCTSLGMTELYANRFYDFARGDVDEEEVDRCQLDTVLNMSKCDFASDDFREKVRQRSRALSNVFSIFASAERDRGETDDGVELNAQEFGDLLEAMDVPPQHTDRIFKLLDTDGSGGISIPEFEEMLRVMTPGKCLETLRLWLTKEYGSLAAAFEHIGQHREDRRGSVVVPPRFDLEQFLQLAEKWGYNDVGMFTWMFLLVDVEGTTSVTAGELYCALRGSVSGMRERLKPEKIERLAVHTVRKDLVPAWQQATQTKDLCRIGLAGSEPVRRATPPIVLVPGRQLSELMCAGLEVAGAEDVRTYLKLVDHTNRRDNSWTESPLRKADIVYTWTCGRPGRTLGKSASAPKLGKSYSAPNL